MTAQSNYLRDRGAHPFAPSDVAHAVLLSDDGLYDHVVAGHRPDVLHRAGAWRLLGASTWSAETRAPAYALRDLLGPVSHPLARIAIAALSEGIALAERSVPRALPGEIADGARTRHAA